MALSKEEYKLLDRMNKRLRAWDKQGATNELVNRVRNDLLNFYLENDMDSPNRENLYFTKSGKLTGEQKEQLLNIAQSMDTAKSSRIGYYKKHKEIADQTMKTYETLRNNPNYNINNYSDFDKFAHYMDTFTKMNKGGDSQSFQDYVDFVDTEESYMKIKTALRQLPSATIARVYSYGKEFKLTDKEINKLLAENINNFNDGDKLEMFLKSEIEKFERD